MSRTVSVLSVLAILALLWLGRYEVVPLNGPRYVVLDRLTGAVRMCDWTECVSSVNDPAAPAKPYDDLIPKK